MRAYTNACTHICKPYKNARIHFKVLFIFFVLNYNLNRNSITTSVWNEFKSDINSSPIDAIVIIAFGKLLYKKVIITRICTGLPFRKHSLELRHSKGRHNRFGSVVNNFARKGREVADICETMN